MKVTLCKLCRSYGRTEDGLDSLIGLYDGITLSEYPGWAPEMVLVTEIEADVSEDKGRVKVDICLINEDGKELVRAHTERSLPNAIEGRPSRELFATPFEAGRVPIACPGTYRFDVLLNDRLAGSERLYFHEPAPKAPALSRDLTMQVAKLPGRQREVFELVGKGLNNREIAEKLKLSVTTVRLYSSRLLQVFGCKNRTQLALKARGIEQ